MTLNLEAILMGALSGLLAAALVDFQAFQAWKSFKDATTYDWPTAAMRWVQGAITGAIAASGLSWVR
jgi:hypothetical protein